MGISTIGMHRNAWGKPYRCNKVPIDAIKLYLRVLPDIFLAEGYYGLGIRALNKGRYSQALKQLQKAVEIYDSLDTFFEKIEKAEKVLTAKAGIAFAAAQCGELSVSEEAAAFIDEYSMSKKSSAAQ